MVMNNPRNLLIEKAHIFILKSVSWFRFKNPDIREENINFFMYLFG